MKLSQLAQQLLGPLVLDLGSLDHHFHDLIAALVLARIENALLAQPKFPSVGRSWRDFQQRAAVNRGHFDLRAQAGLGDGNRHFDLDIVSVAVEERMLLYARRDVEIACRSAQRAGIAFARNPQPRAVLRPGRNVDGYRLGARDAPVAMTGGAGVLQLSFTA